MNTSIQSMQAVIFLSLFPSKVSNGRTQSGISGTVRKKDIVADSIVLVDLSLEALDAVTRQLDNMLDVCKKRASVAHP